MPRISPPALWNEIFNSPKFPACMGSLLAFKPNPVNVHTSPGPVLNCWNAPETPENVPNSFRSPVPPCGPTGEGLGADSVNVFPNALHPGDPFCFGPPTAVPVSNP